MSFNTQENFDYLPSPALSVGAGKIPIDSSSISEVVTEVNTNTAAVVNGVGEPNSFNGQEVMFDYRVPTQSRIDFTKSFLQVTGIAANMAIGINSPVATPVAVGNPPVTKYGVSIPWNTIAALFDTAELQMNQSATLTEQITQNLGDASMVKMLTMYTREALEANSDEFFTPCIEETRDTLNGGISVISQQRTIDQLVRPTAGNLASRWHSKNIPLADIFESLRIPAAMYLQNLQIKIRPKATNNILMVDPNFLIQGCIPRYFVTGMRLYLTLNNLTESQLAIETRRMQESTSILRQAFYTFDAVQKTHSQSASYRDSNIKNMQAAVFLIPSTTAADARGFNRYQYCYGSAAGGQGTGISSFQQRYENVYSPSTPLPVSPLYTDYSLNTRLFAQYRILCRRMTGRELSPAIRFDTAMGTLAPGAAEDNNPYVLFCSPFYSLTAFAHKVMAGADHEIITQGGNVEPLVIVRIRMSFLEIAGNTSVYVIN